ncbi:MAG: methionyl-tRNA formyltransferase [Dehalococcoidia bacterium]|jgi:methionyl-tRNA formyltransferase|nr:methionyl-tRNA formyltransferase [Dehalococcoidia bacterium]
MTRLIFFGTPRPAAKSLRALVNAGHEVNAVYTRPDRVSGRSREPRPTPVKATAMELGLPVYTPSNLRGDDAIKELAAIPADVFVVLAYGRILPPAILGLPPFGVLNVHPSLLPLYRGPSPVVTAIREGAPETGVSVMLLDKGMDTGPVIAQSSPVPITEADDAETLTDRLFAMGVDLLVETIPAWVRGDVMAMPQDDESATVTRLVEKVHGELDFVKPAIEISRAIRAYHPWPGTFTRWDGKLLKILEASASDETGGVPGVVSIVDDRLLIATGEGSLEVKRLQLEGRSAVTTAEFLRGYPAIEDACLPDSD